MTNYLKYGQTNQKQVDEFFKQKKKKDEGADAEQECAPAETPTEVLGPAFAIVEPIDTIVGPLGKFQIKEENFPWHCALGLFGKRRTGKTFSLRWLLYNAFRRCPFGVVFTNTKINGFWQVSIFIFCEA